MSRPLRAACPRCTREVPATGRDDDGRRVLREHTASVRLSGLAPLLGVRCPGSGAVVPT